MTARAIGRPMRTASRGVYGGGMACRTATGVGLDRALTSVARSRRARLFVPLALVVLMLVGASPALADRVFSTRFSTNDTGNITFAANTLMVCPASASGCTAARNAAPVASGSNAAIDNNAYLMQYVNTAPGTVSGSPSFDSSSATLSLPATATVLFAGLYWGADTSAGSSPNGVGAPNAALRNQVGFGVPGVPGACDGHGVDRRPVVFPGRRRATARSRT